MALAKVTIEALTQMANILRQSADDILATKEQMDNALHSFPWDDPIGRAFIIKYEEDFKPLKEKLIPNIEKYIQYMQNEGVIVAEYSGENLGGMGVVGVGASGAIPHITNEMHLPLDDRFIIPNTDEFSDTFELLPGDQIKLDNGTVAEVVPIANGCGTENGFARWAAQTGAGIDAALNSSKMAPVAVGGIALVGFASGGVIGGINSLIAISKSGKLLNPEEFDRLNNEVCAAHDICYVEGDKVTCEKEFYKNGGRFMSIFTYTYGNKAYKEAQQTGIVSKEILERIKQGKKVVLPNGYLLKIKGI